MPVLADDPPAPVVPPVYVSPYGKVGGIAARIADWHKRLRTSGGGAPALGEVAAGSFWGGLIQDLEQAMQILNLREFADYLRLNGDENGRKFAAEMHEQTDTLEAIENAAHQARDQHGLGEWPDPVAALEALDGKAGDYEAVRRVLVETGALDADDTETPVADLVRALLS